MPNIKFSYSYRDSANYKNFDFIIFQNPDNISLSDLEQLIISKLIDKTFFYANQWNVPSIYSIYFDPDIDPTWHEFENIKIPIAMKTYKCYHTLSN